MPYEIRIMFSDFTKEKQNELLDTYGIRKPEDMNWDIMPVTILMIEDD